MKIKRWLRVLLCMLLCIGLMPVTALAANAGELWINGEDIAKAENYTVSCGNGTAVYNPSDSTLTLTDAAITEMNLTSRAIDIPKDTKLEIVLNGENTINVNSNGFFAGANSDIIFSGNGSLTISCNYAPFVSNSNVTVDGAALKVSNTVDGAIQVDGKLTIQNGAYVEATGLYYGIQAGSFSIAAGSELNAASNEASCNANHVLNGYLSISDSTVTATASGVALWVSNGVEIKDGAKVVAESGTEVAIYSPNTVSISGSTVDATSPVNMDSVRGNSGTSINGSWIESHGGVLNANANISNSITFQDNAGAVVGKASLLGDVEITTDMTLDIPEGTSLTIPAGKSLTNNGVINLEGQLIKIGNLICNSHNGGEATCSQQAVCNICTSPYGEVNVSNHANLVKIEAKPETHLEAGNKEYWYCDGCDKYFSDEAGTKEISFESTVLPNLPEHTADDTGWHSDKNNHWNTCECGEVINKAVHTFGDWMTTKAATSTEAGIRTKSCTVCGYKVTESIPATGTTNLAVPGKENPNTGITSPTGNNSNLALWLPLLLASGGVVTGTALYSRKRKKYE